MRRRRSIPVATLAIAVASVVAVAVVVRSRDQREREAPGPPALTAPAPEYRIVYRIDDTAGGTRVTTTEEARVRRPFDARIERRNGPPPGGETISVQISRLGRLALPSDGEAPLTLAVPPGLAVTDLRFDPALDWLIDQEVVDTGPRRTIAGRTCAVIRLGAPPATGEPVRYEPGSDDYTDECIDAAGLVLEEVWVSGGTRVRRKVAVEVEWTAGLTEAGLADPGPAIGTDVGGGSFRQIEASPFAAYDVPGHDLAGHFEAAGPEQPVPFAVDVWVNGPDAVLVEYGPTGSSSGTVSRERDDPDLGEVTIGYGLRMNEVRYVAADGQPVRVRGTLRVEQLLEIGRRLQLAADGDR